MTTPSPVADQAPRRRPRDRRRQILDAGAALFVSRGFEQTGMSDIAERVGISASALYRHFPSKRHMLSEVVSGGLEPMFAAIETAELHDVDAALDHLAGIALDGHELGVLWQREARHLLPVDQVRLTRRLLAGHRRFAAWVRTASPAVNDGSADFLAWALLALLVSPSFHHVDIGRAEYQQILARLLGAVFEFRLGDVELRAGTGASAQPLMPASRREALLAQATRMFARSGFESVSLEEIAAAVGIAGPSVYNHFATKADLLTLSFRRTIEVLFSGVGAAYASGGDAEATLRTLAGSYVDFTRGNQDFVGVLITEPRHLSPVEQEVARRAQHDYLTEWTHLLQLSRPSLTPGEARIRVHAVVDIINSAARVPQLNRYRGVPGALGALCHLLLFETATDLQR
ncbi:TetR/AcrR family transcriptional regulator [Sphaerisporangium sp. NPDC051011]|uniref:TetR/AcrR family transcriptional regulator n=1 Tax=Sphaerisporangium sp. NPDC051011 TaxID=3155792 RepID=UPI0033CA85B5